MEDKRSLNGSEWSTAKLSALLKNPIYVRADADIFEYYERHGVQMITDISLFNGEHGARLYGRSKHPSDDPDWSDMKLVLLIYDGLVDSDIWLKCQRKLEKNRKITNSFSSATSWLAGKVVCEKCGYTMTTIKGKTNRNGESRRYVNCTGKSHKKVCTGPKVSIYAEDLEQMIYDCISEKLADPKGIRHADRRSGTSRINELKQEIKRIEQAEK